MIALPLMRVECPQCGRHTTFAGDSTHTITLGPSGDGYLAPDIVCTAKGKAPWLRRLWQWIRT